MINNVNYKDEDSIMDNIELLRDSVHFGIIAALPIEYVAFKLMLENPKKISIPGSGAGRRYLIGEIPSSNGGKHYVALAIVADMGNNMAATRVTLLLEHFPNLESIIMVGIAGGVPNPLKAEEHVRLGDIVISDKKGVIQYDNDKETENEVEHRHSPRPPDSVLLETVRHLEVDRIEGKRPWNKYINYGLEQLLISRPPGDEDVLTSSDDPKIKIDHPEDIDRIKNEPRIFLGAIASANKLLKNSKKRDYLRENFGVKAVEMESSGVADATWNHRIGYLSVRGICDYCDSNKGDKWQKYAAVIAAAYTRTLLENTYSTETTATESNEYSVNTKKIDLLEMVKEIKVKTSEIHQSLHLPAQEFSNEIPKDYKSYFNRVRKLLNDLKTDIAFDLLDDIKKDVWDKEDTLPIVKYEILRLMGNAKHRMLQNTEAGNYLIEAYEYNKNDENAKINKAWGHLFLKQYTEAKSVAEEILNENPDNIGATQILILSSSDESYESIISKVNPSLRKNESIAYSIGIVAREKELFTESEEWLRIALENSKNFIDLKGNLGEVILINYAKNPLMVFTNQFSDSEKQELEESKKLLNDAWEGLSSTEMKQSRKSWIANLSTIKKMLGDLEGALSDINIALRLDSHDNLLIFKKAIILSELKRYDEAEETINDLDKDECPESVIILAKILSDNEKVSEAIKILENLLKTENPKKIMDEATKLLLQLYLADKDPINARRIFDSFYGSNTKDVVGLVYSCRISILTDEYNEANLSLDKAIFNAEDSNSPLELSILADMLYRQKRYEDAVKVYEKFVNKDIYSKWNCELVNCYFYSGDIGKALEICVNLRKIYNKPLKYISGVEINILCEIGDFKSSKKLMDDYIELYPSIHDKLNQAQINLHFNELSSVDDFLNSKIDLNELTLDEFIQLVYLFYTRLYKPKKMLEILYEMRRKYFGNPKAHVVYYKLVVLEDIVEKKTPIVVEVDTAFCIQRKSGNKTWHVIEDKKDINIALDEINSDHRLTKAVLGKHLGEEVKIRTGPISETVKIADIKTKYMYAAHKSQENYSDYFSDYDLHPIFLGDVKKEGEPPEGIQIFLKEIERQRDNLDIIENFYKSGKITIGTFAKYTNRNISNVLSNLINQPDLGVRCCVGNVNETYSALFLLDNKPNLVIDIVSLMTIHYINVQETILKAFKIVIAQSTIDLLQNIIKEYKGHEEGFMTAWKEGDEFIREEIKAEDIKAHIHYLENVLAWVNKDCEVSPCKAALDINRNRRQQYNDTMGKSFVDSILISKESGNLLYSDDGMLRSIAKSEFNVKSIWIQPILLNCLREKIIDRTGYNELIFKLMSLNYNYLIINGGIILQSAEKSSWLPISHYSTIINKVINYIDPVGLARVIKDFAFELFLEDIPNERRDYLINYLLSIISSNENGLNILSLLATEITLTLNDRYSSFINSNSSKEQGSKGPISSSSTSSEKYVANVNTGVFHYLECSHVKKINEKNRIYFNSSEAAKNAKYKPCKRCNH